MGETPQKSITDLLVAWGDGDRAAHDQLMPLVHAELRRLARGYMRSERPGHTLQTTAAWPGKSMCSRSPVAPPDN